jgi:hypothetical protein
MNFGIRVSRNGKAPAVARGAFDTFVECGRFIARDRNAVKDYFLSNFAWRKACGKLSYSPADAVI